MKEIKLIKVGEHYDLYHRIAEENLIIGFASTDNTFENKLSLKNCQEIECCVDLDALILSFYPKTEWDVEIVMGDPIGIGDKYTPDTKPKLDENGCIILKRIKE